jgi:4-hydroxy-tetrahydrodipicolinate synthase
MNSRLIVELAKANKNIVAVKEASGNLAQVAEIINNAPIGFSVYSGDDALAYTIISLGGKGCISVASNLIPGAFSQMCDLASKGEHEMAKLLHQKYNDLFNANFIESNPVPVKTALAKYGLVQNVFRAPFYPWKNESKIREYFETIEKCGVEISEFILQEN